MTNFRDLIITITQWSDICDFGAIRFPMCEIGGTSVTFHLLDEFRVYFIAKYHFSTLVWEKIDKFSRFDYHPHPVVRHSRFWCH